MARRRSPAPYPLPELAVERRAADPLHRLKAFLSGTPARVMLLAESPGRRETLLQYLAEYGLKPDPAVGFEEFRRSDSRFAIGVSPLLTGFFLDSEQLCLITESELYAGTARSRAARDKARVSSVEGMLRDLSELRAGDPVVHVQHGIGRYRGLVDLDLGEGPAEFLLLEYAEGNKLYVPVAQLHSTSLLLFDRIWLDFRPLLPPPGSDVHSYCIHLRLRPH